MLRRVMIAGPGSVPAGHRYWRIRVSKSSGSVSYIGFTEIEFRGVAGGPNLMSVQSDNGAAISTGAVNASNEAWMAADGTVTRGWLSSTMHDVWWKYDFGSPLHSGAPLADVKQVAIYGSYNSPTSSPEDFEIQWSDDNSSWVTALSVTGQVGWTGAADVRLFNLP